MRRLSIPASLVILAVAVPALVHAHCQVPCGIYEDEMRFAAIGEDLTTIEKAMAQIGELGAAGDKNYNQIVRWVVTKEDHAQKIQDVVSAYFLTQRIKPVEAGAAGHDDYARSLELCHALLVNAMKCKQTVDPANAAAARTALTAFHEHYFKDKQHDH